MKNKLNKKWSLEASEILVSGSSSSSGKTGQLSRNLKTTSTSLVLEHHPTGIRVEGEVPAGNYSKNEMRTKKEELQSALFSQLEQLVAKKLKIKGR